MWHLDFILMSHVAGRSELAHLGKLLPMSIHGSWPSFMSQVVAFIVVCGWQSLFVGGSLCLWVVIFVFWPVMVGWSWVVVGVGCHVVVAVGSVVGLW